MRISPKTQIHKNRISARKPVLFLHFAESGFVRRTDAAGNGEESRFSGFQKMREDDSRSPAGATIHKTKLKDEKKTE